MEEQWADDGALSAFDWDELFKSACFDSAISSLTEFQPDLQEPMALGTRPCSDKDVSTDNQRLISPISQHGQPMLDDGQAAEPEDHVGFDGASPRRDTVVLSPERSTGKRHATA